jgi:hypothetical protein
MDLPTQYIKVARDITGYWGAYPPSYQLSPGMIGVVDKENAAFIREDYLEKMPGYNPVAHAVEDNAAADPVTVWTTKRVTMKALDANVATPGLPASGKIQIHFGAENEAAIICNGNLYRSFSSLRAVKQLMLDLLDEGTWNRNHCLVTEVLVVKAAWIFYATEKDQTAEIQGSAPLDLSKFALPIDALKELAGKVNLQVSFSSSSSAGMTSSLPSGGTPFFRAIQLKKGFIYRHSTTIDYTKGPDSAFVEPAFGEKMFAAA